MRYSTRGMSPGTNPLQYPRVTTGRRDLGRVNAVLDHDEKPNASAFSKAPHSAQAENWEGTTLSP